MLGPIEDLLVAAVQAAAPGLSVAGGPLDPGPASTDRVLCTAEALELVRRDEREPAKERRDTMWPANGTDRAFTIPSGQPGRPTAVAVEPGRSVHVGDDYVRDGSVLHFLFAPPTGTLRATFDGAEVSGYRDDFDGRVALRIRSWAATAPVADQGLARALEAALTALHAVDQHLLATPAGRGLDLRLVESSAMLRRIERGADANEVIATALVTLSGRVELVLETGDAPQVGRITAVDGELTTPSTGPFPPADPYEFES